MEFSEIGNCGDTDVDPPDVVILTEGGRPGHAVRVAVDEGMPDTARHVVLSELGDGVGDVLVEMSVWMVVGRGSAARSNARSMTASIDGCDVSPVFSRTGYPSSVHICLFDFVGESDFQ